MPYPKVMAWALVVRTVAIDELIKDAINLGIDTVVNLGAGLDTRPYRMELPSDLRWIELDFPHLIAYKTEKLAKERPVCQLESIAVDLSDIPARQEIFRRIGEEARKALILTEGVIAYLSGSDSALLSQDLFAVPSFRFWIQDYYQGGTKRWSPPKMRRRLKESPFRFEVQEWLEFFKAQGWTILENRLASEEAERIKRPFPFLFPWSLIMFALPKRIQEKWRRSSGYVMYQKPILIA